MDLEVNIENSTIFSNSTLAPTITHPSPRLSAIILKGYVLIIIANIGIIGNSLTLIVLRKTKKFNTSVRILLKSLGIADLCYLLFQGILHLFQYFISPNFGSSYSIKWFGIYGIPIGSFVSVSAQTASIYITILIAFERFIAVTRPLHAKTILTYSRIIIAIFIVNILAIIFAIPHLLVFVYPELRIPKQNAIDSSTYSPVYKFMDIYATWIKTMIQVVFPLGATVYLNVQVYLQIMRDSKRRRSMSSQSSIISESESDDKSSENNLTIMLLFTVGIFSICYLVKLICAILSIFREELEINQAQAKPKQKIMISYFCYFDSLCNSIVELFPTINSSVNFIVFMLIGKIFREEFLSIIFKPKLISF